MVRFYSTAQYGGCYSPEQLKEKFLTTKTLVLLTGDENFDANIKLGMTEYWKLTEYEFADANRIREVAFSKEYSVIQPYQITRSDQYGTQTYYYYGIVIPADEGVGMLENVVANVMLDGFGREADLIGASFRAKHMIKFMQDFVQMKVDGKIDCSCGANMSFMKKHFNSSNANIKNKTLLVDEYYLSMVNKEDFVKNYPGKVEFVTTESIQEAINEKDDQYAYLLPVFTRNKHIYVVDAATGNIYYELFATSGLKLSGRDVKALYTTVFN